MKKIHFNLIVGLLVAAIAYHAFFAMPGPAYDSSVIRFLMVLGALAAFSLGNVVGVLAFVLVAIVIFRRNALTVNRVIVTGSHGTNAAGPGILEGGVIPQFDVLYNFPTPKYPTVEGFDSTPGEAKSDEPVPDGQYPIEAPRFRAPGSFETMNYRPRPDMGNNTFFPTPPTGGLKDEKLVPVLGTVTDASTHEAIV